MVSDHLGGRVELDVANTGRNIYPFGRLACGGLAAWFSYLFRRAGLALLDEAPNKAGRRRFRRPASDFAGRDRVIAEQAQAALCAG